MSRRDPDPLDVPLDLTTGPLRPLPVAWDGVPVDWEPFHPAAVLFICPPPRPEPCPTCGSLSSPEIACGRLAIGLVIVAHRCPSCHLDQVQDQDGQWWTLDDTDYGPEGSNPP